MINPVKATKIKITPIYKSKNKVQHYSIIFYGVPMANKYKQIIYAEIIYHDCTFSDLSFTLFTRDEISKYNISINKKEIIINNAQSFLYNNQFKFEYHEEKSTTALITVQYPKED